MLGLMKQVTLLHFPQQHHHLPIQLYLSPAKPHTINPNDDGLSGKSQKRICLELLLPFNESFQTSYLFKWAGKILLTTVGRVNTTKSANSESIRCQLRRIEWLMISIPFACYSLLT